jgi:hypothetical protein
MVCNKKRLLRGYHSNKRSESEQKRRNESVQPRGGRDLYLKSALREAARGKFAQQH